MKTKAVLTATLILAFAGLARAEETKDINAGPAVVAAYAGALTTLTSEEQQITIPTAALDVDVPVPLGEKTILGRVACGLEVSAYPGEDVALERPETVRAMSFSVAPYRVLGAIDMSDNQRLELSAVGEVCFTSPLPREGEALASRLERQYGVGFQLRESKLGSFLRVMYGRDSMTGPGAWGQLTTKGRVAVPYSDGMLYVVGKISVQLRPDASDPSARDIAQIGAQLELGRVLANVVSLIKH